MATAHSMRACECESAFWAGPQQCEMAVGGKSEVSRPGNFARQQARRHPKKQTWRAAGPALAPAWMSLYGVLNFHRIRSTAIAHRVSYPDWVSEGRWFESQIGRKSPRPQQVVGSILAAGTQFLPHLLEHPLTRVAGVLRHRPSPAIFSFNQHLDHTNIHT